VHLNQLFSHLDFISAPQSPHCTFPRKHTLSCLLTSDHKLERHNLPRQAIRLTPGRLSSKQANFHRPRHFTSHISSLIPIPPDHLLGRGPTSFRLVNKQPRTNTALGKKINSEELFASRRRKRQKDKASLKTPPNRAKEKTASLSCR
jgi:hypothetical protein